MGSSNHAENANVLERDSRIHGYHYWEGIDHYHPKDAEELLDSTKSLLEIKNVFNWRKPMVVPQKAVLP